MRNIESFRHELNKTCQPVFLKFTVKLESIDPKAPPVVEISKRN